MKTLTTHGKYPIFIQEQNCVLEAGKYGNMKNLFSILLHDYDRKIEQNNVYATYFTYICYIKQYSLFWGTKICWKQIVYGWSSSSF